MLCRLCLFILFARISRVDSEGPKECLPNDLQGCSCKFSDDSGIIDLTSLGTSDNTPRFKDVQGQDSNVYSFSACNAFTEGKCVNASMCMQEKGTQTVIGEPGKTLFKYDPGKDRVTAAYEVSGSLVLVSEVEFVCVPTACDPVFLPKGQSTIGRFNFQLTHVCSCPGLCNENGPINSYCTHTPFTPKSGGNGLGPGCLSILLMYFDVGTVFQKVKNTATGSDLVPNIDMWKGLFGLTTLGFRFTFSKCLPKKYQYNDIN